MKFLERHQPLRGGGDGGVEKVEKNIYILHIT